MTEMKKLAGTCPYCNKQGKVTGKNPATDSICSEQYTCPDNHVWYDLVRPD